MKNFKLRTEWRKYFEGVTDVAAGQMIKAIFALADHEKLPEMNATTRTVFSFFEAEVMKMLEQQETTTQKNAANGKKGGRPANKKRTVSPEKRTVSQKNRIKPNAFDDGEAHNSKEKQEEIPYAEIIGYLNEKAGKEFRLNSKQTKEYINGRWKDGYKLDDFKHVVDVKVAKWKGTDMEEYLRPQTLFRSSNFESYLNERMPVKKNNNAFINFEQRDTDYNDLETQLDRQFAIM